jgi:hypothetical protein
VSIASPKKLARDVCRKYGAKILESNSHGTSYQFPDGSITWIGATEKPSAVDDKLRAVHDRFGALPTEQFYKLRKRPSKPHIDFEQLTASPHAQERLALMQRQAGVTFAELVLALKTPNKVLWSDEHNSWMWIGDRVSVAIRETRNAGYVITTVSWSTLALFEKYPRPKGES